MLLCRHHHWSVREGGWTLVDTDHDGILAISPVVGVQTAAHPGTGAARDAAAGGA